jgi:predicted glycosyltransferase
VLFGRGGPGGDYAALAAAARAVPERRWRVLGPVSAAGGEFPPNVELLGWREDAMSILADAELVVGGAGGGLMAEIAALGKRFLCLPEDRPFDEQRAKAARLEALGAAVVRQAWPTAAEWPALLAEARGLDPARIAALYDPDALRRTAAFLDAAADRHDQ